MMQSLTGNPRRGLFTKEQVLDALTWSPNVEYDLGLEQVDVNGVTIADLSDNFVLAGSSTVEHNSYADVHGTCQLVVDTPLQWGVDYVKPYMVLKSPKTNNILDANQQTAGTDSPLAPAVQRINLCTNPDFESATTGWAASTNFTIAQSPTQFHSGTKSLKGTATSTGAVGMSFPFTAVIGQTYTASAWVWNPVGNPTVGAYVASQYDSGANNTGPAHGQWTRLHVTWIATVTSETFWVFFSALASGQLYYIDDVLIEKGALSNYFDGGTITDNNYVYAWTGTAHLSTSTASGSALPDGVVWGPYGVRNTRGGVNAGYYETVGIPTSIFHNQIVQLHGITGWGPTPGYIYTATIDATMLYDNASIMLQASITWFDIFDNYMYQVLGDPEWLTREGCSLTIKDMAPDGAGRGQVDVNAVGPPSAICDVQTKNWQIARVPSSLGPRFDLGVYIATSPQDIELQDSPIAFQFTGYDKIYLLNQQIGHAFVARKGAVILDLVADIIQFQAKAGTAVIFDNTASTKTLSASKTWLFSESEQHTWLNVVNDLLAMVSYRGIWCDDQGNFRSEPYVDPGDRAVEFTFASDDALSNDPVPTPSDLSIQMIPNGDFDTDLSGWSTTGGAALIRDTLQFVTGDHSMQITWSNGAAFAMSAFVTPTIKLDPGSMWDAYAMVRVPSGGSNPRVILNVNDSGPNSSGMSVSSDPYPADSLWYPVHVRFIVQNNGIVNFSFQNYDASTSGRIVNIDDVQLRPAEPELVYPTDPGAVLQAHIIVEPDRTVSNDQWNIPNKWIFIRNGLDVAPVEGAGQYTYVNQSIGPASVSALGRTVPALYFIDASSQADLVAKGKITVNADLSSSEVFHVSTALFPVAGHFDVFKYYDPQISGRARTVQAQNWQMALDGEPRMTWQWESIEQPQYVVYGENWVVSGDEAE